MLGGEDYVAIEQMLLTFNGDSNSEMCISVDLLPDNITEIRVSFLVLANSSDPSVNVTVDKILISIIDNDSKICEPKKVIHLVAEIFIIV